MDGGGRGVDGSKVGRYREMKTSRREVNNLKSDPTIK